jgi:formate dehydrogenase maturation protein FdhE
MMNFRKHVAMYLMKLAAWTVAEYGPDVAAAIENVVWAKQKNARKYIESLIAAYYDKTNIPPEEAVITVEQTAKGWEIFIDPKPQEWEETELV